MRLSSKLFFLVTVCALAIGPALTLPRLNLHTPTLTAPSHQAPAPHSPLDLAPLGIGLMGAIRIKDTGTLAKKFVQRAGAAGADYTEGVKAAGSDWETRTKESGDNWAAGTQQAIADKRFERGVSEAGAAKYVGRASTLGAQRFPSGVAAAEGDWAKNTQPHLDMMKSLNLPPRRPKGDPANQQRAAIVAAANRKLKVGG